VEKLMLRKAKQFLMVFSAPASGVMVRSRALRIGAALVLLLCAGTATLEADFSLPNLFPFPNSTGFSATYSATGSVDLSGPFFQSLGTNGRSCGTCHQPSDAFGLSAANARLRYLTTRGKDPLFAQFDGSTCPTGPINNALVVNNGLHSYRAAGRTQFHRSQSAAVYDHRRSGSLRLRLDEFSGTANSLCLPSPIAFNQSWFFQRNYVGWARIFLQCAE
jgi:hypothetical protein